MKKAITIISIVLFVISSFLTVYIWKYDKPNFVHRMEMLVTMNKFFREELKPNLDKDSTFVILTIGQSNAANSSKFLYQPHNLIYNYYNGDFFVAKEPLLGIRSGIGGSVWTLLGDKLIDRKKCKTVVFVPIGIGGTDIDCWTNSEDKCFSLLKKTMNELQRQNIKLTHIVWHHGEADNGKSKKYYKAHLLKLIDFCKKYTLAPFYCSIASYSANSLKVNDYGVDNNIEQAQIEVINERSNVFQGPNTDHLIRAIERFDGNHFSKVGLMNFSELLYLAISKPHETVTGF